MTRFCEDGVWAHGDVTICFQDCVLQSVLCGLMVVVFLCRCVHVCALPTLHPHARMPAVQQMNTLVSTAIVAVRGFVAIFDWTNHQDLGTCVHVGDLCALVSWGLALLLILIQAWRGKRPGRFERYWWLLALVVAVVRFRTDIEAVKHHHNSNASHCSSPHCFITSVVRIVGFGLQVAMGVFGLFQRDTMSRDFKSESSIKQPLTQAQSSAYGTVQAEDSSSPINNNNTQTAHRQASLFERLTFSWFNKLLQTGAKTPLDHNHLYALPLGEDCKSSAQVLKSAWEKHGQNVPKSKSSLFRAFLSAFGSYFFVTGLFKVVNDVSIFAGPLLLNKIVSFLEHNDEPMWHGYVYAAGLFVCNEVQSIALGQYFIRGMSLGLRVRAAVCSSIYQKSLVLSFDSRSAFGIGRIVSLMQIDAQKICDAVPYLHLTWSAPFQLALALYFLHAQVGVSAFAGLAVLILMMPFNTYVGRKQAKCTRKTMETRDKRVKMVNEVVSGVRIVKMFGWEHSFMEQIGDLRRVEMSWVRTNALWGAFSSFLWTGTPLFVSVVTFAVFVWLGHSLTASKAFTSLALFNVLRFPLNALPMAITQWIDVSVSNKRLWEFLVAEEHTETLVAGKTTSNTQLAPPNSYVPIHRDEESRSRYYRLLEPTSTCANCRLQPSEAIKVIDGTFSWPVATQDDGAKGAKKKDSKSKRDSRSHVAVQERKQVLRDVNLSVENGSLVCIVGAVGSGKSTLLDGLLGESRCDEGSVWLRGRVAFCAQQAWIQNASVRDNILFGQEMDTARYEQVLDACALRDDLRVLPSGDDTEIGERGINLSGGQKQRVALARACYAQADVFLLDDVLSAVDVHVGKHIVENCLLGLLKGKTRVIATHQIHWLSLADSVIVLKDGKIFAQGKYADLVSRGIDFGPLAQAKLPSSETASNSTPAVSTKPTVKAETNSISIPDKKAPKGKLIQEEEREKGVVALRIWKTYAVALGKSFFLVVCVLYMGAQGVQVFSNIWLGIWSDDKYHRSAAYYLAVYCGVSLVAALFVYVRVLALAIASVRAGKRIHDLVLWSVLRSPTSFFDSTPLGRILNRLSQDQQTVDVSMRMTTQMLLNSVAMMIGATFSILYATPYVAAAIIPVGVIYVRVQHYYRASARELQRLDSISKSPIYVSFSETLSGISTVRAFRKSPEFSEDNQARINKNLRAALSAYVANRWLAIRLEFLGSAIVGIAGVIAVLEHDSRGMAAGLAGLSLTYALEVTNILNWLIRVFTSTELQMVSVERLMQWEKLPSEAELTATSAVPRGWPSQGRIVFDGVWMKYREDLDPVLKGVSFVVESGQRVGIVGRTGSGKSSLLVTLFRLVEINQGSITIDGVNTKSLGLHDLRKQISIIPQDPTLFSGTLRRNLDPFSEHTENDIWEALRQCYMETFVRDQKNQLEMIIEPGGENLSVGQRQLVCLGRALLRKSRILVLDEATASIDGETDVLIQKSLQQNLQNCTVLTIAHRIHTVQTSDKIIVMDDGQAKEIGSPEELMKNPNGLFYKLATGVPTASTSAP